jgi:3-oxoacyl-[acyl-carrier-protein] synthase III
MLYLHALGHYHPETIIDNCFLEDLDIGADHEWIVQRTGIRTRRTVLTLDYIRQTHNRDPRAAAEASVQTNGQTGAAAARMAMERAGVTARDIGMVIGGGCSPQWSIPAEACMIAAELGIEAPAFDINSACSSFGVQMRILCDMGNRLPDFVLVVSAENTTRSVDYSDRKTCVLWGDGTSAAIVSARIPAPASVENCRIHSQPAGWDKVTIRSGRHFAQEGAAVQAFAIRTMTQQVKDMRRELACDLGYFIGHQANLTVLESVCARTGTQPERHLYNVDEFGNCGAAGAPSVLSQNWSRFQNGDTAAVAVLGSGLTWAALGMRFGPGN